MHRLREERRIVLLQARVRAGSDWGDITICNISSRGLMARCAAPLPKGTYIEIRHRNVCIVARVVWCYREHFGVRTQERIDIPALLMDTPRQPVMPGGERRLNPRDRELSARRADVQAAAEASRHFARAFDWGMLVLAAAAAAGLVFQTATASLQKPLQEARKALVSPITQTNTQSRS